MVRYNYDIFGAITAVKNGSNQTITDTTSIAFLNPLRYRGYVYDDETGLYYLQSRYYDPVTGRFINADVYADTGSGSPLSTNMFAYCENNALRRYDSNGNWYEDIFDFNQHLASIRNTRNYSSEKKIREFVLFNYDYNRKCFGKHNDFIYGQRSQWIMAFNIPGMVFGKTRQKIGEYGCVAIAIYNVMRTFTYYVSLPKIISELELNGLYALGGFPLEASLKYFDAHSIRYRYYKDYFSFMSGLSKHTIATVWTIKGHVYCIINIGKGKWRTLNRRGAATDFETIKWSIIKKEFQCAYGIVIFNRR